MGVGRSSVQGARVRALLALLAAVLGVVVGVRWSGAWSGDGLGPVLWFSAAGVMACGSISLRGRWRGVCLVVCVGLASAGWTLARTDTRGTDRLDRVVGAIGPKQQRVPVEIEAVVIEPVRTQRRVRGLADPPMWPQTRSQAWVRVGRVYATDAHGRGSWVDASGDVRLLVPKGTLMAAGSRVRVLGMYAPSRGARNAGDRDWRAVSAQSGRVGTIVVGDAAQIEPLGPGGLWDRVVGGVLGLRWLVRGRAMAAIGLDADAGGMNEGDEGDEGGAMLAALLLGQREPSFEGVYETFQRVGAAHVLAISGFHLALVVLLAVVLVRAVGEHPGLEALIVVGVLGAMVLVIPMRPPIVRAAVIVGALLVTGAAGRRYDRMTVLAWVGVGLIVWRPLDALGLGYQLSMGVTGLLVVLSDRNRHALLDRNTMVLVGAIERPRGAIKRSAQWLGDTARTNLACWLVATPAIVYHAGLVSLLAPVVAMVLIPMVMVLMVAGYVQIVVGVVAPGAGVYGVGAVHTLAGVVMGFVAWADALPGAWARVDRVSAWWAIGATLLAALVVTRAVRWRWPVVLGLCVVAAGWVFVEPLVWRQRAPVRIDMLDVGDGSCVLVHSGGRGLVWDCGSLDRRVGESTARAARALGIGRLSDAVVTHDDLDHFNGLPELARLTGIERVWITDRLMDSPSRAWARVAGALTGSGVEIKRIGAGDTLTIGRARLEILWPDPARVTGFEDNDTSVVARLTIAGNGERSPSVLLTGDIEAAAMDAIVSTYPGLDADVIELPHHGSARDRAYGFVRDLSPAVVLQSTGPTRLDDERWAWARRGRDWYTTAAGGGVWVTLGEDGRIEHGWVRGGKSEWD